MAAGEEKNQCHCGLDHCSLSLSLPLSLSLSGLVDMASSSVAEILNSGPVPLACVRDDARRTLVALLDAVRGGFAEERAVF